MRRFVALITNFKSFGDAICNSFIQILALFKSINFIKEFILQTLVQILPKVKGTLSSSVPIEDSVVSYWDLLIDL